VVILNQEQYRFSLCNIVGTLSKRWGFICWSRVKHYWLSLPRYGSGAWPVIHSSTRGEIPYMGSVAIWRGWNGSMLEACRLLHDDRKYQSNNGSRKGRIKMCSSYLRPLLTRNGSMFALFRVTRRLGAYPAVTGPSWHPPVLAAC
jgi:hypothetical protein